MQQPGAVAQRHEADREPHARRGRMLREEQVVVLGDEPQRQLDRLRRQLGAEPGDRLDGDQAAVFRLDTRIDAPSRS